MHLRIMKKWVNVNLWLARRRVLVASECACKQSGCPSSSVDGWWWFEARGGGH